MYSGSVQLRAMQRGGHERIMLHITWKGEKGHICIRKQIRVRDVLEDIGKKKWTWVGHVARMADHR